VGLAIGLVIYNEDTTVHLTKKIMVLG